MLLAASADPNLADKSGITALMWAAHYDHTDIVQALLAAGANPDSRDDDGRPLSDWAARDPEPGSYVPFTDRFRFMPICTLISHW